PPGTPGADREGEGGGGLHRQAGQRGMAAPPVGGDQSVTAQHLQRLPYRLPADAEVTGQLPLARQPLTGRDGPGVQLAEQLRGDPPVQGFVLGRRGVLRGGTGHAAPPGWSRSVWARARRATTSTIGRNQGGRAILYFGRSRTWRRPRHSAPWTASIKAFLRGSSAR